MRRTRAQMLAAFDRLDDIFRYAVEHWMRPTYHAENAEHLIGIPSRAACLEKIEDGTATPTDLIKGVRQALNDIALGVKDGKRRGTPATMAFLDRYRAERGTDFLVDIGNPIRTARAVAKRGRISDETEYYLVREVLGDVEAPLIAMTLDRLGRMLDTFAAQRLAKGTK